MVRTRMEVEGGGERMEEEREGGGGDRQIMKMEECSEN